MSREDEIYNIVAPWQDRTFRGADTITMQHAATTLASSAAVVQAKQCGMASKWMLYNNTTNQAAVITHAGIWAWGTNNDTGNFVPVGETPPGKLRAERIQRDPNFKCEVAYAFNTSVDDSFYSYMKMFENEVVKNPRFNKVRRPRRIWQSGDQENTRRYVMTSRLFVPHKGPQSPAHPSDHPWLRRAVQNSGGKYSINPRKPAVYEWVDDSLVDLTQSDRPQFDPGDIIWMSFTVGFNVGNEEWWPDVIPIEFVRVGRLPEHLIDDIQGGTYPEPEVKPLIPGLVLQPITQNRRGNSEEPERDLAERLAALRATSTVSPSDTEDESQNIQMSHLGPEGSSSSQESDPDGFVDVEVDVDHDAVAASRKSTRGRKGKSTKKR